MVEINKLLDIAFLFMALAGAVQLTSLIFQRSLTMYLARKRCITRLLAYVSTPAYGKVRKVRAKQKYWKAPGRCEIWWSNVRAGKAPDSEWKDNFRMSMQSFYKLCDQLRPFVTRHVTNMRKPVDVPTQVAVTLYYLSDGGRMRKTANSFGLALCTVSRIVERVTKAISRTLVTQYIIVPTTVETVEELV